MPFPSQHAVVIGSIGVIEVLLRAGADPHYRHPKEKSVKFLPLLTNHSVCINSIQLSVQQGLEQNSLKYI